MAGFYSAVDRLERYEGFVEALGSRLAEGPRLTQEIAEDVSADGLDDS